MSKEIVHNKINREKIVPNVLSDHQGATCLRTQQTQNEALGHLICWHQRGKTYFQLA